MKKIISTILVLALALAVFGGCGETAPKTNLTGTTAEILKSVNDKVNIEISVNDGNVLELFLPTYGTGAYTEEEFKALVVSGNYTGNALTSQYHHIIVLEFKNASDALAYKDSIAKTVKEFHYVCGSPESYYINDSANYVFVAVTFKDSVEKFAKAFEDVSGKFGTAISGDINV